MKRYLLFGTLTLVLAAASTAGGYWLGFRHAWSLGQMADAAPRGAMAIGELHLLEKGTTEPIRLQLESDVDSGLRWWYEIDQFPLRRGLNALSGSDVIPGDETYVRRLAVYRNAHPSPLADALNDQVIENARKADPAFAKDLEDGLRRERAIVQKMLEKYGR